MQASHSGLSCINAFGGSKIGLYGGPIVKETLELHVGLLYSYISVEKVLPLLRPYVRQAVESYLPVCGISPQYRSRVPANDKVDKSLGSTAIVGLVCVFLLPLQRS